MLAVRHDRDVTGRDHGQDDQQACRGVPGITAAQTRG